MNAARLPQLWRHSMATTKRAYGKKASAKVHRAMSEMKEGKLKSGRSNKTVKNPKQAIAIGLSEARQEGGKVPSKSTGRKTSGRSTSGRKSSTKSASGRKSTTSRTSSRSRSGSSKGRAATSSRGRSSSGRRSSGRSANA